MKQHFKLKHLLSETLTLMVVIVSSCEVSNLKLFSNVQNTTDTTYGFTKTNPISFTNGDMQHSTDALIYYLNHLRTTNDKKLIPLRQFVIDNPEYNPNKFRVEKRFGEPTGLKERFLDLWVLKVENEIDTINLFFNISKKDTIRVPVGFKFIQ